MLARCSSLLCCFILCTPLVTRFSCDALYLQGTIQSASDWMFLTRFCFLSQLGSLEFSFVYPMDYMIEDILLYHDDQWGEVYPQPDMKCEDKLKVLKVENSQVISLTPSYEWAGCGQFDRDGRPWLNCTGARYFRSQRERWWFIVLSSCGYNQSYTRGKQGIYVEYNLLMANSLDPSDWMYYHLSADEFYIIPIDITFFLLFLGLMNLTLYAAATLRRRSLFHTTFKLFVASVILNVLYTFFSMIAYIAEAHSGYKNDNLFGLAMFLEWSAVIVFLVMLLLIAKGYTITRGRLPSLTSAKLAVFITVYSLIYIILYIYQRLMADPGLVLYIYESAPGICIVVMRLIAWMWFLVACFFTMKKYPSKSAFYLPFALFYTCWFLVMPAMVIIAANAIPKYARQKTVHGIDLSISFVAHSVFLFLTRPTAANKNFPYHVRTTQIGIMSSPRGYDFPEAPSVSSGQSPSQGSPNVSGETLDKFGSHLYAPDTFYNYDHVGSNDLFAVQYANGKKYSSHDEFDNIRIANLFAVATTPSNGAVAANGVRYSPRY